MARFGCSALLLATAIVARAPGIQADLQAFYEAQSGEDGGGCIASKIHKLPVEVAEAAWRGFAEGAKHVSASGGRVEAPLRAVKQEVLTILEAYQKGYLGELKPYVDEAVNATLSVPSLASVAASNASDVVIVDLPPASTEPSSGNTVLPAGSEGVNTTSEELRTDIGAMKPISAASSTYATPAAASLPDRLVDVPTHPAASTTIVRNSQPWSTSALAKPLALLSAVGAVVLLLTLAVTSGGSQWIAEAVAAAANAYAAYQQAQADAAGAKPATAAAVAGAPVAPQAAVTPPAAPPTVNVVVMTSTPISISNNYTGDAGPSSSSGSGSVGRGQRVLQTAAPVPSATSTGVSSSTVQPNPSFKPAPMPVAPLVMETAAAAVNGSAPTIDAVPAVATAPTTVTSEAAAPAVPVERGLVSKRLVALQGQKGTAATVPRAATVTGSGVVDVPVVPVAAVQMTPLPEAADAVEPFGATGSESAPAPVPEVAVVEPVPATATAMTATPHAAADASGAPAVGSDSLITAGAPSAGAAFSPPSQPQTASDDGDEEGGQASSRASGSGPYEHFYWSSRALAAPVTSSTAAGSSTGVTITLTPTSSVTGGGAGGPAFEVEGNPLAAKKKQSGGVPGAAGLLRSSAAGNGARTVSSSNTAAGGGSDSEPASEGTSDDEDAITSGSGMLELHRLSNAFWQRSVQPHWHRRQLRWLNREAAGKGAPLPLYGRRAAISTATSDPAASSSSSVTTTIPQWASFYRSPVLRRVPRFVPLITGMDLRQEADAEYALLPLTSQQQQGDGEEEPLMVLAAEAVLPVLAAAVDHLTVRRIVTTPPRPPSVGRPSPPDVSPPPSPEAQLPVPVVQQQLASGAAAGAASVSGMTVQPPSASAAMPSPADTFQPAAAATSTPFALAAASVTPAVVESALAPVVQPEEAEVVDPTSALLTQLRQGKALRPTTGKPSAPAPVSAAAPAATSTVPAASAPVPLAVAEPPTPASLIAAAFGRPSASSGIATGSGGGYGEDEPSPSAMLAMLRKAKTPAAAVVVPAMASTSSTAGSTGTQLPVAPAQTSAVPTSGSAPSPAVPSAPPATSASPQVPVDLYGGASPEVALKFARMLKVGVPSPAVRGKMAAEGLSQGAIEAVLRGWSDIIIASAAAGAQADPSASAPSATTAAPPVTAVAAALTTPSSASATSSSTTAAATMDLCGASPELALKFARMLKVGVPPPAVRGKMAVEGLSSQAADVIANRWADILSQAGGSGGTGSGTALSGASEISPQASVNTVTPSTAINSPKPIAAPAEAAPSVSGRPPRPPIITSSTSTVAASGTGGSRLSVAQLQQMFRAQTAPPTAGGSGTASGSAPASAPSTGGSGKPTSSRIQSPFLSADAASRPARGSSVGSGDSGASPSVMSGRAKRVTLLDAKRGQTRGVCVQRHFKSIPAGAVAQCLMAGVTQTVIIKFKSQDGKPVTVELTSDQAGNLHRNLLPDPAEVALLQGYKGDPNQLAEVESFFYGLKDVPSLPLRASALAFRSSFVARAAEAERRIGLLTSGVAAVSGNARLPRIIDAVNRLIGGGDGAGDDSTVTGADGASSNTTGTSSGGPRVTLTTLSTLKAVTDASGKSSLLQHIVSQLMTSDPDAASLGADAAEFSPLAAVAGAAASSEMDTLTSDVAVLARELKDTEAVVARLYPSSVVAAGDDSDMAGAASGSCDPLSPSSPLPSFLAAARARLEALQTSHADARAAYGAMMTAYGDDAATAGGGRPEEVLRALHADFVVEFGRARTALTRQGKRYLSGGGSGSSGSAVGGPSYLRR